MSIDNAKRFLEAAAKDEALQQKLDAAGEKDLARIAVQAGSERGLSFTAQELLSSIGPSSGSAELSDHQLEAVAGGMNLSPSQQAALNSALRRSGGGLGGGLNTPKTPPDNSLSPGQQPKT
jgi:predicted ribosomally synthesized peptide with nif11-like leader